MRAGQRGMKSTEKTAKTSQKLENSLCSQPMRSSGLSCHYAVKDSVSSVSHQQSTRSPVASAKGDHRHKSSSAKKLLFVCGGTGGHIFPAIAVAEQVVQTHAGRDRLNVQFMGVNERDCQHVQSRGFSWVPGKAVRVNRPFLSISNVINIFRLLAAVCKSILYMLKHKPDAVMGTGGYVSWPACIAACVCMKPLYLCEPNVVPGVANRFLAPFARRVFVSPACDTTRLPKDRISACGVPVRSEFSRTARDAARSALGLKQDALLLTVLGGSSGSLEMSEAVLQITPGLLKKFGKLVIHAQVPKGCGPRKMRLSGNAELGGLETGHDKRFKCTHFFGDMAQQLAASDIVLSRAGAGACAELLQMKVPSVLWPLASSADGHQLRNAEWMEGMGVAVVFNPPPGSCHAVSLRDVVTRVIGDNRVREVMSEHAKTRAGAVPASSYIASVLMRDLQAVCV